MDSHKSFDNYVSPEFLALRKEITSIVDKTM